MFADNQKISHRQLFRQMVLGLLGSYLIILPVVPGLSGRQGIFAILLICVCLGAGSIYFIRIRPCYMRPEKYFGKYPGKIFCLLYVAYLFVTGVFLLLVVSDIAGRFFIEGSRAEIIIVITGIVCYLGSHEGLERRGRMAEVCFPVILFILVIMLLLVLGRVNPAYLQDNRALSPRDIFLGFYKVICLFLPAGLLPFTLGNVEKAGRAGKAFCGAVFLTGGFLIFCLILLQGVFGIDGYMQKPYPVFDLMAGVDFPGDFMERIDIFWIAAVMFCVFFSLGSIFFYNHEILYRGAMEKGAPYVAGGIVICALASKKAEVSPEIYGQMLFRFFAPMFFLLGIGAGIAYRRGKHYEKEA